MYLGSEHRGIGLTGDCHVRVYVSHLQLSVLYFMFVRCKRSIPLAQRSVMQNMIPHNCLFGKYTKMEDTFHDHISM